MTNVTRFRAGKADIGSPISHMVPRHNIQVEQALLGAVLLNNNVLAGIPSLQPEHFFESFHGTIFDVARTMHTAGRTANPVTLKSALPAEHEIIHGLTLSEYLARLAAEATTTINAPDYARLIEAHYKQRCLSDIASQACEATLDPREAVQIAFEQISELQASMRCSGSTRCVGDVADDLIKHISNIHQNGATTGAIPTGLRSLDQLTGGFKPGDLVVCAARPGMGKSTLATTIAHSCAQAGYGVRFQSLEMPEQHVIARMITEQAFNISKSPVEYRHLLKAEIGDQEFQRLIDVAREMQSLPLLIDDASSLTVAEIAARARAQQARGHKLDLLIIDYLKMIRATARYQGQRHYEVGEITAGLKQLARDLGICVMLLAQLNREVEKRQDKRPQLSDLRESGDIEADADLVLLLFWEAYYLQNDPSIKDDLAKERRLELKANELEIIVAKQRMGPIGSVLLHYNPACAAVRDLTACR